MTAANNQWDYEKLQYGMEGLRNEYATMRHHADGYPNHPSLKRTFKEKADALQHLIEFIEWNIKEGEILTPLQTYLTEK